MDLIGRLCVLPAFFLPMTPLQFWQGLSGLLHSTHGCIFLHIKLCLRLGGNGAVLPLAQEGSSFSEDGAAYLRLRAIPVQDCCFQPSGTVRCHKLDVPFNVVCDVAASFRESVLGSIQRISYVNSRTL